MRSVLGAVGFTMPAGPKRALLALLIKRIQIRMRGFNFIERKTSEIPEADLFRIDICWAVAAGLGAVDLIRGADFQCRHLLLALNAGEPFRIARGLAFEAAQSTGAARGTSARSRPRHLGPGNHCLSKWTLEKRSRALRTSCGSVARPVHRCDVGAVDCASFSV